MVDELNNRDINLGEFVYYSPVGLQGPIKIWEINYPSNIKLNSTYLDTDYPAELETINPLY